MSTDAVHLSGVSKEYPLYSNQLFDRVKEIIRPGAKYHTVFQALKSLDLEIKKGETVGILGRNGAGKSTLLKVMAGVKQPTSGIVRVNGTLVALLELGAGFNPDFTGIENIHFYCSLLGLPRKEIERIVPHVIEFAEIGGYINQPLKLYSTGMKARLAFSVSVHVEPDILILDEVLSVGDILFQRKCFKKMEEFFKSGRTVLFVSHNVESVRCLCRRSLLLHEGELIMDGPTEIVTPVYYQLMFASEKEQPGIVARIKESMNRPGGSSKTRSNSLEIANNDCEAMIGNMPAQGKKHDYFIEGFESKSRHYSSCKKIDIHSFFIDRQEGGKVTHLARGNSYRLVFTVDFNETLKSVSFVSWFYSERTHLITGTEVPDRHHLISEISEGSRYRITVEFQCSFNPGLYGIRLVVRGELDQEIVPVSIVEDAIIFSVLDDEEHNSIGFVKIANTVEACEIERSSSLDGEMNREDT